MENFMHHIVSITILLFFFITYFQSGVDKILDWKGNVTWLKGHFSATFLKNFVPLALALILFIEIITAVYTVLGIYNLIVYNTTPIAIYALFLSCITLLMLLFGQRLAKDYQGALTITCYFIVSVFGLYVITA